DVVEAVTSGGAIQGRVLPLEVLRQLSPELPKMGNWTAAQVAASYATGLRLQHKVTGETIPPAQMPFTARAPLAADGTFALDGLNAGDWRMIFCYTLHVQGLENMEVELPAIEGLADHELRVVDVDVSKFSPGQLDAAVTRDGQTVGDHGVMFVRP